MSLPASGPMAAAALLLSLTASTSVWAQTSISMIAISESGLWGPDLERIESGLRKSVSALGSFAVQSKAETVENFAEARELGIDCQSRDVECATKIGLIAGADKVLLLRAAPKEGSFYLTLLLVDVAAPDDPIRVTQWAPTSGAGFETAIEEAAVRLFAPDQHRGSLKIQLTPPTAGVVLDGAPAAPNGDGVIEDLKVGNHKVVVELKGYRAFAGSVQVRFKETSALRVSLDPIEDGVPASDPVRESDPPPAEVKKAPPTEVGTGVVPPTPDAPVSADEPAPLPLSSPFVIGGAAAVGLGVVGMLAGGALGLVGAAIVPDTDQPLNDRKVWQAVGIGGLAAAVLAGGVAVTGAAAIVWGLASPSSAE